MTDWGTYQMPEGPTPQIEPLSPEHRAQMGATIKKAYENKAAIDAAVKAAIAKIKEASDDER